MFRRRITLGDFDPRPIIEYNITTSDLSNVYIYLQAMQAHLPEGTWKEIRLGGHYGTSALLHEVVELRILLNRDPYLLTRSKQEIKAFARHSGNYDAHLRGLEVEYRYLQPTILRVFHKRVDIGALVQANTGRFGDWDDLFETTLPFFEPTEAEIAEAELLLTRLRQLARN